MPLNKEEEEVKKRRLMALIHHLLEQEALSVDELRQEAVRYGLTLPSDRYEYINLIMPHPERNGLLRDLFGDRANKAHIKTCVRAETKTLRAGCSNFLVSFTRQHIFVSSDKSYKRDEDMVPVGRFTNSLYCRYVLNDIRTAFLPIKKLCDCRYEHDNKKKQSQLESEQQQNFMNLVCAGYHALLRIFQYLKVQELLRAARVCTMWRDLAAHPSLWKTVRLKNTQVIDWDGLADTLQRCGTQHLDLRKMVVSGESDNLWKKFLTVIPRVTSLVKLELCRCPVIVVEEVIKSCPQLEVFSAMSIKCESLTLESIGNLSRCQELRLKAITEMSLLQDLTPLQDLEHLTQLSLTSVKELGKKKIDVIQALTNLETLELGECSDFPDKFGTTVLINLNKLERLRLEKGQGSCCTFDILEGVSKLKNLSQMELVNFDVNNGFDKCLANCKNIKRLLIIPTYIRQSATSNNMVLGGVIELSDNLTHFIWGITLELLKVMELFITRCNLTSKQVTGDSIPVLKPVPCLGLIDDVEDENEIQKDEVPQVEILPLPQLQKLLFTALPKTRVKILKIPFLATEHFRYYHTVKTDKVILV